MSQPGRLTVDHWAGKRESYVAPLKLYVAASAVFFSYLVLAPPQPWLWWCIHPFHLQQVRCILSNTASMKL